MMRFDVEFFGGFLLGMVAMLAVLALTGAL